MRLYRGLKKPYRADLVAADRLSGTDFTKTRLLRSLIDGPARSAAP